MQRIPRIAIWLLVAFLAFAPPGTMIFLTVGLWAWLDDPWLFAAVVTGIAALVFGLWTWHRRTQDVPEPAEPT